MLLTRCRLGAMSARVSVGAVVVPVLVALVGAGAAASKARPQCMHNPWRNLVLVSARTGAVDRSFPDADDNVDAVVSDGQGGWFVSGIFECVGTAHVPGLVHLHSTGTLDHGWHAALPADTQDLNGYATATMLTRAGHTLYAGGTFAVEALNASTGAQEWLAPVSYTGVGVDGAQGVDALAANSQAVYLGGGFTAVDGTPRESAAALDPATGKLLAWQAPTLSDRTSSAAAVEALALDRSHLFIGGNSIATVGGQPRPAIAALDAGTGQLTPWVVSTARGYAPGYGVGDVETIVVAHPQLLTAGHDGFGAIDATTGKIETWMYRIHGSGYRFATYGDIAYLGGNIRNGFDAVAGKKRNNLAAIDLTTNRFTSWAPKIDRYVAVASMGASRGQVLIAGSFSKTLG